MTFSPRVFALAALAGSTALPALAQEVNVYSYRQPELIEPLTDAFTEETGIKVNIVYLEKGVAERLKAEGARSPADLALTVDITRLAALKDAGVLQAVESEALEAAVPAEFQDPDNQWFALTSRARIVYASKDRVSDDEVTTYEDLASEKWRGRICTRSGLHAYNVALTAGMMEQHGEAFTREWLEGLKANLARKPQGNDRAQVKAVSEGECDISLGNTYYMALMLKNDEQRQWADAVRILFPTFEDGGTHVNVSGMGLTKAAPNKENAIQLMEFLASEAGQKLYAEINHEFPVNPAVSIEGVMQEYTDFTPDDANLQDLADLRSDAVKLAEEVDFDG